MCSYPLCVHSVVLSMYVILMTTQFLYNIYKQQTLLMILLLLNVIESAQQITL